MQRFLSLYDQKDQIVVMKRLPPIAGIFLLTLLACGKESNNNAPLLGRWVEKTYRLDTLEVYVENTKTIMFDNSYEFRLSGRMWPNDEFFRHQIFLKKDSIGLKSKNAPRSEPFYFYSFEWITYNEVFRMSYNGLRPHLSSIGTLTFERLK